MDRPTDRLTADTRSCRVYSTSVFFIRFCMRAAPAAAPAYIRLAFSIIILQTLYICFPVSERHFFVKFYLQKKAASMIILM